MPNHIQNKLTISGDENSIGEFKNLMGDKFSLENIIPTPTELLENDSDDVQTIDGVKVTQAVVTPSRNKGDDLRYDWNSKINFTNNVSSTTRVDLISGSLPDGLTLETGLIDNEYISLSGNIEGDLFGIDLTQYENLYKEWYSKQQTSFETIEYIDNLTDKNILSNPPLTFSIGDTITNVDEGSRDIRTINSVYTYDTTKTAVDVDTFVPVVNKLDNRCLDRGFMTLPYNFRFFSISSVI